jgi:hypothetical protein
MHRLLIVSDFHYACDAEKARRGHEARATSNRFQRAVAQTWRRYFWLRDPFAHNRRLDQILEEQPRPDWVVANGDYTVDTAFVGVSDDAAFESARVCLGRLKDQYVDRLTCVIGDHDLGKKSLFGAIGGPRILSLERMEGRLGVPLTWRREIGRYTLLGLTSSVAALPLFEHEIPTGELHQWRAARTRLFAELHDHLCATPTDHRVLLFVHDPSALPCLYRDEVLRSRLGQIERTVIGHLHSPVILNISGILKGMPRIRWLGTTALRYSSALNEGRCWKDFHVVLCPSPHGMQAFKDGGYLTAELCPDAGRPIRFKRHRLAWPSAENSPALV